MVSSMSTSRLIHLAKKNSHPGLPRKCHKITEQKRPPSPGCWKGSLPPTLRVQFCTHGTQWISM